MTPREHDRLMRIVKMTALALFLAVFLAACSAPASTVCPPLIFYTPEFSAALAAETEAAPVEAVFPLAIADYLVLRRQLRACQP